MAPMLVGFFSIHCLLIHAADHHQSRRLELLMVADLLSDEENT